MTLNMLFIIQGDKLCKNLQFSMAKLWIFLWWIEMIYLFLEAHKTMICSRNKQFLMPSHEDCWSYCSMFLNETSKLKENNESEILWKLSLPYGAYQVTYN